VTKRGVAGGPIHALAYAVGIYRRAAPASAVLRVAASLAASLAPVATAWLTKAVLDQLITGSGQSMLPAAAALAISIGLLAVVQHVVRYTDQELGARGAAYTQDRLFVAVGRRRGLTEFEDPAVHDRLRLAQQASSMAPQQLAIALLAIAQSALTAGAFLVSLATVSPLLVGLVAASAVPTLYPQLSLARDRAGMMLAASPRLRRQLFYGGLLLDLRAAKEIRLFGLAGFFRGRMLAELASAQALERRQDRRTLRTDALLSLLTAMVSGVALVVGVAQIARNGSAGDLSVLIAALAGVQSGLAGAIAQVASISETLILFDHYLYVTTRLGAGAAAPPRRGGTAAGHRTGPAGTGAASGLGHRAARRLVPLPRRPRLGAARGGPVHPGGAVGGPGRRQRRRQVDHRQAAVPAVRGAARPHHLGRGRPAGAGPRAAPAPDRRSLPGLHELRHGRPGQHRHRQPRRHRRRAAPPPGRRVCRHPRRADVAADGYGTTLSRTFLPDAVPTPASGGAVRAERASRPRRPTALPAFEIPAGVLLSGGQWQRVALARAVLRDDADLLVLDEPSAGLDVEAEAAIHARLRRLRQGRTSLLISHRMNTVRSADLIVVLDAGRVVEQGSHQELIATEGRYAHLFRTQASGYQLAGDQQEPMAGEPASPYP
jgi:ATP-binding cassette subfamily B protein